MTERALEFVSGLRNEMVSLDLSGPEYMTAIEDIAPEMMNDYKELKAVDYTDQEACILMTKNVTDRIYDPILEMLGFSEEDKAEIKGEVFKMGFAKVLGKLCS
jgi:hypothetical protein